MRSCQPADDNRVGPALLGIRHEADLTQDEVAAGMGLTGKGRKNLVSRLESGRVDNPEFLTVVRFVRACGAKWEEFCDLYDPVTIPRVDTRAIDRTAFSREEKQDLKRKLQTQVYKYNSRTTRWVKGEPMPPAVLKRAQKRFAEYRQENLIVEAAAKKLLDGEKFPSSDRVGYLNITRCFLGLTRRASSTRHPPEVTRILELARRWRLDREIIAKLQRLVDEHYAKFAGN